MTQLRRNKTKKKETWPLFSAPVFSSAACTKPSGPSGFAEHIFSRRGACPLFIGDKQGADCGAAETGPTCRVRVGGWREVVGGGDGRAERGRRGEERDPPT